MHVGIAKSTFTQRLGPLCLPCATTSWRQKGGRTVALVVQGWYTGRSDIAMDVKFWACSKQSQKGRRGCRSFTGRSKEAGGRHTHHSGRKMDAHWSAIGRLVKNARCCEHCVSIWATLLPSLCDHCASLDRPIAFVERSMWRPLCLHSATTASTLPYCAIYYATTAALVVQGRHRGRAAAVTQKPNFLGLGDHWAS